MPGIPWVRVLLAAAVVVVLWSAYMAWRSEQRDVGREEVRAEWAAERARQTAAALAESQAKSRETLRRIEVQERNQHAKDLELAAARADAELNAADAQRVREQSTAAARDWAARLADSPTAGELQAAAEAIRVCTDVLGRADRRAGILAAYADAARAAGSKCAADYDALRPAP